MNPLYCNTHKVKYLVWPLTPWNLTLAPQHEDSEAQEEEPHQHYDPVAAATAGWGDDGSQPVRYDPIAAAQEGWGDDGTLPVRYDPVAPAQEEVGVDEQVHYDPVAEAQEDWGDDGDQPVTEEPAPEEPTPEDETPAAEAPAEEEATPAAATLDDEEGQVTEEREKMERCIWMKKWWMHRFLRRWFEHGVLERNIW